MSCIGRPEQFRSSAARHAHAFAGRAATQLTPSGFSDGHAIRASASCKPRRIPSRVPRRDINAPHPSQPSSSWTFPTASPIATTHAADHAQAHRHPLHPDHRRRPDHHRPGLRVRLFRRPGLQGAAGRGLPRHPGQFQSRHHHDRSRAWRTPPISSRSRPRSSRRSSPARSPTRCCRPWAARPRSTPR